MYEMNNNNNYYYQSSTEFLWQSGEKRPADEPPAITEEPRKKKIEGDVSTEVIAEILEVTSDPKKMQGPDVSTWFLFMHVYINVLYVSTV